jgi:hypothetical protein
VGSMDKVVRVTHWAAGFLIDWPSGTVSEGLTLAEVNLRLASEATGLVVQWSDEAQKARLKELRRGK